jgi:hypothetical protein
VIDRADEELLTCDEFGPQAVTGRERRGRPTDYYEGVGDGVTSLLWPFLKNRMAKPSAERRACMASSREPLKLVLARCLGAGASFGRGTEALRARRARIPSRKEGRLTPAPSSLARP